MRTQVTNFTGNQQNLPLRRAPLWLLGISLALPSAVTFIYFVLLNDTPPAVQQTSYVLGKGLQFVLPAFWCLLVLREPLRLPVRGSAGVATGVIFGIVISGAMWLLFTLILEPRGFFHAASLVVQRKMMNWGVNTLGDFLLLAAFYAFIHALLEEYYWRWFVYRHLSYHWKEISANSVSSVGFMAHHVLLLGFYFGWTSPLAYLFSLAVAIGGSCWAWLYQRSGSLLGPWLSHLLIDASIFLVAYSMVREIFT